MGVEFEGDWERLERILGPRGIRRVTSESHRELNRQLRKVEGAVLDHLDNQDLDWEPLSDAYKKRKEKKGLSENILRASNQMYSNITVEQAKLEGNIWSGMVGVARGVKTEGGEELTDIAIIHEQPDDDGTKIPARKLWKPTFEELKDGIAGELIGTVIKVFKK